MLGINLLTDNTIKNHNTLDFQLQLTRDKIPIVIPEGVDITIRMSNGTELVYESLVEVIDANKGIIKFDFEANVGVGDFKFEIVITNGKDIHLTFPDNDYGKITVNPSLLDKLTN